MYDRIVRKGGFTIQAAVDRAFPLFTPEGELSWADGWSIRRIFPTASRDTVGGIFATTDDRGREMIWRIQKLDCPRQTSYFVVTSGSHTTEITVQLQPHDSGATEIAVEYVYTPFTSDGEEFLRPITEEAYSRRMESWEREIRHYLATGSMLRHHSE